MLKNKSAKKKVNKELLRLPDVYVTALSSKNELKAARSATTGEKFDTLDERIDCELDRLNKKIEVSKLEQEDKESHLVENTVNGMTTDMIVKGRTLNNLYKPNNTRDDAGEYILVDTLVKDEPKDRVVYIVNNTNRILLLNVYKISGELDSNPIIRENSISKLDLTGKRLTGFLGMYDRGWTNSEDDKEILRNTCIVLDREETYMPQEYFDGIKSFGQQENKISTLSSGKNRCDGSTLDAFINGNGVIQADRTALSYIAKVFKGGEYSLNKTGGDRSWIGYFTEYPKIGDTAKIYNGGGKITIPNKGYIVVYVSSDKNIVPVNNVIVSEGSVPSEYTIYKEDKKDILLSELGFDEGLRGLNDSVYDELNSIRNVAIKRVDKRTFTGDENWKLSSEVQDDFICFYIFADFTTSTTPILCNNFIQKPTMEKGTECVTNNGGGNSTIRFKIQKSKLGTLDMEGFKNWLKANPTTVYFELAEPIETPLGESINVKTFGERTYVSFENSISGTSSFKAPVNTVVTISRLNRENRALEEENKTLRQDFESTTLSLTDSDLELVKQNVDMDFRLMEVEFALDIPQSTLSSNINFKKKGEVKSMARTPYEMMKIVILSGDYDREDYIHKVGKYYERGRMTKEEYDELMSLMTADEVISK